MGQREGAVAEVIVGRPGQAVGGEVLPVVRRLAGVDVQVIHRAREAAHVHRAEIAADARAGIDQHLVELARAGDAAQPERHAVAQRDAIGRDRRPSRARRDVQHRVIGHADIARHRQGRGALHRQRAAAGHAQITGQAAGRTRHAIAELQCASGYFSRAAQRTQHRQLAARYRGLSRVGDVIAGQVQRARAGLQQRAAAGEAAAENSVHCLLEHQRAAVVDVAREGTGIGDQRARLDPGIAIGVARVAQAQRARACLDEVAAARYPAGQPQGRAGGHVDAAGLRQRNGARRVEGVRRGERAAAEHQRARRTAQIRVAPDLQRAAIDPRAAAVGIVAAQHQRAGPGLPERTGTRHHTGQAQRGAACHVDAARLRQRDGARRIERTRRGQRATVEHQAARGIAQVRIAADSQGAARDRRAARVMVAAIQDHRAGAALDETAPARHRAVQAQRGGGRHVEAPRLRERHGTRDIESACRGQRAAVECQAAHGIAQACIAADLQRTAIDRRAAAVGIVAAQHQRAGALFDESAHARDGASQAQRRAGGHVDAAGLRQRDGARSIEGPYGGQRAAVERQPARGRAQVRVAVHLQRAAIDPRAARVAVVAAQHQRARAGLGQRPAVPARRGVGGLVGQRRAHHEAVGGMGQRERAVAEVIVGRPGQAVGGEVLPVVRRLAGVDVQVIHRAHEAAHVHRAEIAVDARAGIDQHLVELARAGNAAQPERHAIAQRDAVGRDRRAARASSNVQHRTIGHADVARHRQGRRALHRQCAANGHPQVAGKAARRTHHAIAELQRAPGHFGQTAQRALHHQRAFRHGGLAGVGRVIASQIQGACAGLPQRPAACNSAAKSAVGHLLEHQRAAIADVTAHGTRVADQRARLDPGIAIGVARVAQAQRAGARLDEVAAARHPTRQAQGRPRRHIHAAGLRQRDGTRRRKRVRGSQRTAAKHQRARHVAQVPITRNLQGAVIDPRAAAIGVGAVQHQRSGPGLDERAAARHQA
ncbi:hypothetical protein AGI3411_05322 [Achromobacter agilis]|uniref:Uncharacterized protein n=1 Tax=Achromobacter agilis TaxID=1353888 RepID=A0A446CVF0_9BURK|nr:hypothetical protein AGI3411_05322 [Achromobacter agilis]